MSAFNGIASWDEGDFSFNPKQAVTAAASVEFPIDAVFSRKKESQMGNGNGLTFEGQIFSTSNRVVRSLPVGTVLEVVGDGALRVGAPKAANGNGNGNGWAAEAKSFQPTPGDRIYIPSKDRYGIVVRAGVSFGDSLDPESVVYLDETDPVVRVLPVGTEIEAA